MRQVILKRKSILSYEFDFYSEYIKLSNWWFNLTRGWILFWEGVCLRQGGVGCMSRILYWERDWFFSRGKSLAINLNKLKIAILLNQADQFFDKSFRNFPYISNGISYTFVDKQTQGNIFFKLSLFMVEVEWTIIKS